MLHVQGVGPSPSLDLSLSDLYFSKRCLNVVCSLRQEVSYFEG
jgi:hypothetical protein